MPITDDTLTQVQALRVTVGTEADDATSQTATSWASGWDDVAPLYAAALTGIAATALVAGVWPGPWELARHEPLQHATRRARAVLSGLATGAGVAAVTAAGNATLATVGVEPGIMASQLPAAERKAASRRFTDALGATGTAALVGAVAPTIGPLTPALAATSVTAVNRVLTGGAHPTGSVEALTARVLGDTERAFNAGLTSAIAMVRTETLDAYRAASRRVHSVNSVWLAGWHWRCSLDRRCCPACWAMHGTLHPLTEPGPLGHPNCRCGRVVKLRPWVQLGFARKEPADRFVDARTRFDALPEADQLAIMGPSRLALLRSGAVGWDDLAVLRPNPGWRPAYAPRTVAALQSIARVRAAAA